jgi:protein phosphatase
VCANANSLDELVEQLIAQANQLGGRDNISCIVLGRAAAEPVTATQSRGFFSRFFKPLTK